MHSATSPDLDRQTSRSSPGQHDRKTSLISPGGLMGLVRQTSKDRATDRTTGDRATDGGAMTPKPGGNRKAAAPSMGSERAFVSTSFGPPSPEPPLAKQATGLEDAKAAVASVGVVNLDEQIKDDKKFETNRL